ncbi:MAG: hypothetical protein EXQ48_07665 [Acidobacteria bacterium]|nr:hypothetical protein [Acidobacteriota bacterium]
MRTLIVLVAALLLAGTAGLSAHEDFRIIGTISKRQGSVINVKERDGTTAAVRLDKQTAVSREKKKVDASELKVGLTVVIDAYGDSEKDLLALEIRIVPPISQGATK